MMRRARNPFLATLGWAIVTLTMAWPVGGQSQTFDKAQPPGGSLEWLCRGLPQDRIWGPSPATSPADAKKCAGTLYLGILNNTNQSSMFGLSRFVPPYAYHFGDSYFVGGSLSRTIAEIGPYISYELEAGAGQRLGSLHEEEVWLALYGRWRYFPWNDYVRTTVAASTGINYASAIPQYEVFYSSNNQGNRLLHYFSPEVTFGLPSMPDTDFVIRNHHRSGGGKYFGNNFPLYGSLFHGVEGGAQYLTFGVRQRSDTNRTVLHVRGSDSQGRRRPVKSRSAGRFPRRRRRAG
jgi:hypothetical protein